MIKYSINPSQTEILAHIKAVGATRRLARKTISGTDYAKEIGMVGESDDFQNTAHNVLKFAGGLDVLILGETGTGKELIAGRSSPLKTQEVRQFVAVNCAAFKDANLRVRTLWPRKGCVYRRACAQDRCFEAAQEHDLLDEIHQLGRDAQANCRAMQGEKSNVRDDKICCGFSVDLRR